MESYPAEHQEYDNETSMRSGTQFDELETFLDAQDLILPESNHQFQEESTFAPTCTSSSSSLSSSSSPSSSSSTSSPQSLNFNSEMSVDEELKTPTLDFSDPISSQFNHQQDSNLTFDFDFGNPLSLNDSSFKLGNPFNSKVKQEFQPQDDGESTDWSHPSTFSSLWPSLFNNASTNPQVFNQDQWAFNARIETTSDNSISPSLIGTSSTSSSSSVSSSSSDHGGAREISSASTSTYNTPPPPPSKTLPTLESKAGPAEKKRKVSSSGASRSNGTSEETTPATAKAATRRQSGASANAGTRGKRKQSNSTNAESTPNQQTSNDSSGSPSAASSPVVSTKPLPVVDTSVSHSSLFVPPDVTGLSKKDARLVKNRAAAFLSRQRKREEFGELEKKTQILEGACKAIWSVLGRLKDEIDGGERVEKMIKIELDRAGEKCGEVLEEVLGKANKEEKDQFSSPQEEKGNKKGGNKKGKKRERENTVESSSSTITMNSPPPPPPISYSNEGTDEVQALKNELNQSKIQNLALLRQLAVERSTSNSNESGGLGMMNLINGQEFSHSDSVLPQSSSDPHSMDLDLSFAGTQNGPSSQDQAQPTFSYPSTFENSIPEEFSTSIDNPSRLNPLKRPHHLSLAPSFTSSFGNGPASPFSLSIPGTPILHNQHLSPSSSNERNPIESSSTQNQGQRKTASGMALMVILFSFALWGMPSGSGTENGMGRLGGSGSR